MTGRTEAVEDLIGLFKSLGLSEEEAQDEAQFALKFLIALDGARTEREHGESTESDPNA